MPVFARRFGGLQCLLDFWMVESCGEGVSMYCIFFPRLLPFGSSDWHTTVQHRVDKDLGRCAPPSGKSISMGVGQPNPLLLLQIIVFAA